MTKPPEDLTNVPCPYCKRRIRDEHRSDCAGTAALEETSDRDREWFEAHPAASVYYRPVEAGDYGLLSLDALVFDDDRPRVRVIQLTPGVRTRRLPPSAVILAGAHVAPLAAAEGLFLAASMHVSGKASAVELFDAFAPVEGVSTEVLFEALAPSPADDWMRVPPGCVAFFGKPSDLDDLALPKTPAVLTDGEFAYRLYRLPDRAAALDEHAEKQLLSRGVMVLTEGSPLPTKQAS